MRVFYVDDFSFFCVLNGNWWKLYCEKYWKNWINFVRGKMFFAYLLLGWVFFTAIFDFDFLVFEVCLLIRTFWIFHNAWTFKFLWEFNRFEFWIIFFFQCLNSLCQLSSLQLNDNLLKLLKYLFLKASLKRWNSAYIQELCNY